MALKKSVSTLTLLSSAVAGIIGSGWLMSPLATVKIAGPAAILSWILGACLMMCIASTFVILTRKLPITGGTVRFFQLTHGHFAGFGFSWIAWLAWIAVAPIEAMAVIQYITNYFPALMTSGTTPTLTHLGLSVAIGMLVVIAFINSLGMKVYSRANHMILAIKLIIPIGAAILLLASNFHVSHFSAAYGFMPYGIKSVFAALPLAGVIYSFIGFNPVVQLAAESKDPNRGIPIAIFGALFICLIIYLLVQIAFIGALPSESIMNGWSYTHYKGDTGPLAGLLTLLGFFIFVKLLYVDACVSPMGTVLVQSMATSRITYAMCENGYFPSFLKETHKNATPLRAIIFNTVIGFLFFLPFPSWQHMVGFLVSCLVLGYVVGPMSLMVLARKNKKIQVLCLCAFYICNLLIFWSGWATVYKMMILFIAGYTLLLFMAFHKKHIKIRKALHFSQGYWVLFYLVGTATISYYSSFGGKNVIPFGWDFLVVAVFTLLIYGLAYATSREGRAPQLLT